MVSCAFAVTGRSEIANAVLINRSLILLVLLDVASWRKIFVVVIPLLAVPEIEVG
jgi:hypothetical protein